MLADSLAVKQTCAPGKLPLTSGRIFRPGRRPGPIGRTQPMFMHSTPVADLINLVIQLYIYVLIATAVLSWLVSFGIVNRHNPVVTGVGRFCYALTEPVLRPIRKIVPLIGGVDLSALIVILVLWLVQREIALYLPF
jgi:YggT family protein